MRFKKLLSGIGAVALLAGGLTIATATIAEAHTPEASATCSAVQWSLTNYNDTEPGTPAVTHQEMTDPGSPAIPHQDAVYQTVVDQEAVPAIPAVTHTEYEFEQIITHKTKWEKDPNWNAEGNWHSLGWFATGNTKTVIDVPEVPAIPEVTHQELVTPEVPGQDAVPPSYETIVDTPAVPDNHAPNTVVVTVNGTVVYSNDFGSSDIGSFTFADKYQANDWSVQVSAWDDPQGYKGYSKTISGTSTPCTPPVVKPEKPQPIVTVSSTDKTICDSKTVEVTTITVTVDWTYDAEQNVWVKGSAVSNEPVVTTRAATEGELTAADCAPAVVIPPTTPPTVTPTPPVTKPAPVVDQRQVRASEGKELAVTGQDFPVAAGLTGLAALLAGIGALTVLGIRRRRA